MRSVRPVLLALMLAALPGLALAQASAQPALPAAGPESPEAALDRVVSGLEGLVGTMAATGDEDLGDAVIRALRATAAEAGNGCTLYQYSLEDEVGILGFVGHLIEELGLEIPVTPEMGQLFANAKSLRTMLNTLKDRAGSLPGTAEFLVRIDAMGDSMRVVDDRLGDVMRAAAEAGRVRLEGNAMQIAGDDCPS